MKLDLWALMHVDHNCVKCSELVSTYNCQVSPAKPLPAHNVKYALLFYIKLTLQYN